MKRFLAIILTALLVSPLAHAAADSNANSMNDAWERRFNQGQLLAPSILPAGDADGDGVSNHDECLAGTDLFDGTPPLGFLQANVRYVSAVYSIPEGGGAPVLDSPEAYVISWPAEYGKLYSLQCSPDLSPQSWLAVDDPEYGYGEEIQVATLPTYQDGTVADKFFWRVSVNDIDSDNDGITDAEEYLLTVDDDHDGVPDEWERYVSWILLTDYGVVSPRDPALFDVNADYGGLNTTALSVYQSLVGGFELATAEVVAVPDIEGAIKTIDHFKGGFVAFPTLYPPPQWQVAGPVINFYKKLRTEYHYDYGAEAPLVSYVFAWTEQHGHCIENTNYAWNTSLGWAGNTEKEVQNFTSDTWQWWWDNYPDPPADWYIHDHSGIYLNTFEVGASGDPPATANNRVVGQWTTNTPTTRAGSGAEHSTGTQAIKPVPGVGYEPQYRTSETFTLTQELSDPYTTENLIADAQTSLAAAFPVSQAPVAYRNLAENESQISLRGGKYRLSWTLPSTVPTYPGNPQAKAVFIWQEIYDPETITPSSARQIRWKHSSVSAAPGTLALTEWRDLPPPQKDGTTTIRAISPTGSITLLPKGLLINKDDDDGNGQEDRKQTALTLATENDLIPLSFSAAAPAVQDQAMIHRLDATGAGKVRLWAVFPNQPPQLVALPYKLQPFDSPGSGLTTPAYYIEATQPGAVTLKLHAEVFGQKLALLATAGFQSLDIGIDFAPNMKGVIGDLVASNLNNSNVHFVTTKNAAGAVELIATGINPDEITEHHANQLVEWVEAIPTSGAAHIGQVSRAITHKYPVSIRVIGTGQTIAPTNIWVTWAYLSAQSSTDGQTPLIMAPQDVFSPPPNSTVVVGYKFSGKLLWRYVCEPTEMFNFTSDVPNFNQAPTVPAPGIHPWTGASLSPGATLRYDASRQTRVVARSNDSGIDQLLHNGRPDIATYPSDPIEGNDDPDLGVETFPYQPLGTTAVLSDADYPNIELLNSTGSSNPNATIFELAQFRQFARVQIGTKWYLCSDYGLTELTRKLKRDNGRWIDDGSTFVPGNSSTFPPPP